MYDRFLGKAGYRCSVFTTLAEAKEGLEAASFDLLLLDWMLPDGSADTLLSWVRSTFGWELPVLVVTSRDSESDIVNALWMGADDYMVKPPRLSELLARCEALLRRGRQFTPLPRIDARQRVYEPYSFDPQNRRVQFAGSEVALTQKEFELALYMFENQDQLLSRVQLLNSIWRQSASIDTRTIDTHVSNIRRKLRITPESGWQITPVYGYGYRLSKMDGQEG